MAEYRLANGTTMTDEDVEREDAEYTAGTWKGRLERIHQGPAAISTRSDGAHRGTGPGPSRPAARGPRR